jgi:F-type H+-transporting ATPase subunit delta
MSIVVSKVAEPYAEALLSLTQVNNNLKETTNDINIVSQFLTNSSDLKKFLANPLITREAKKNIVKDILGEQVDANTLKFLLLLVDRNRIAIVDEIIQKFLELSYKQESIEVAKVISSIQLSAQQQQTLAEKLKKITGAKQIKLALKVDPKLIAGFQIEIGSKFIDTSIRSQLFKIGNALGV